MTIFGEDLHTGPFVATVADHVFAATSHNRHFTGIPQLTFIFAGNAELEFE